MAEDPGGGSSSSAAWRGSISRVDEAWQRFEARLCAAVLVAEIASLTLWVSLKGLSSEFAPGGNGAGLVYRCVVTAAVLGAGAHLLMRKFPLSGKRAAGVRRLAMMAVLAIGLAMGRVWVHVGVGWSSNVLNWLQNASALMLVGGLRGLATRLTLWLALLGASLATSRGKHIHVDVLAHHLPPRLRAATAIAGLLVAAAVCILGVVGFVDYICIAEYRVSSVEPCPGDPGKSCDTSAAEKLTALRRQTSADFFLLGRQLSLDAMSLPEVVAGHPYDKWMTAAEWNAWLESADWTAHFDRAAVDALRMDASPPSALRMPQVAVPGTGEEARGVLIRELNFVFPFGLAVIAVKLLLSALLLRVSEPGEAGQKPDETSARRYKAAT
jgi:TRAP-type C4-dicarboxylate transport system permease small subunit